MAKVKRTSVYFDRESNEFVGLTDTVMSDLAKAYKHVDLQAELSKMKLWIQSPKGRTRLGTMAFITSWLNNVKPLDKHDSPLGTLFDNYLEDLWKNSAHILEFNTIRST